MNRPTDQGMIALAKTVCHSQIPGGEAKPYGGGRSGDGEWGHMGMHQDWSEGRGRGGNYGQEPSLWFSRGGMGKTVRRLRIG